MKIVNGILTSSRTVIINEPVWTKKTSGPIKAHKFIVNHYTAGWTAESAIAVLGDGPSSRQASAHFVIDRDGSITQMVNTDTVAWHAGPSEFEGYKSLNNYSIGLEFVNIGYVRKNKETGDITLHTGPSVVSRETYNRYDWETHSHATVGSGEFDWMLYTPEQYEAARGIYGALLDRYPSINNAVSHEEIDTRGWKTDPGPAFDHDFTDVLIGEHTSTARAMEEEDTQIWKVVSPDNLNVRSGPSMRSDVAAELEPGQYVEMVRSAHSWSNISWWEDGERNTGWVYSKYIVRIEDQTVSFVEEIVETPPWVESIEAPTGEVPYIDRNPTRAEIEMQEKLAELDAKFTAAIDAMHVRVKSPKPLDPETDLTHDHKKIRVMWERDGIRFSGDTWEYYVENIYQEGAIKDLEVSPPIKGTAPTGVEKLNKINERNMAEAEQRWTTENLNLRTSPNHYATIIIEIPKGKQVLLTGSQSSAWYGIKTWIDGVPHSGWVNGKYLRKQST